MEKATERESERNAIFLFNSAGRRNSSTPKYFVKFFLSPVFVLPQSNATNKIPKHPKYSRYFKPDFNFAATSNFKAMFSISLSLSLVAVSTQLNSISSLVVVIDIVAPIRCCHAIQVSCWLVLFLSSSFISWFEIDLSFVRFYRYRAEWKKKPKF